MWVVMIQHKTSDQYLTSGKVSTSSIHGFKRYRLLKILTKNFNILSNADADMYADADTVVTAIALPVLSYRRAKKVSFEIYITIKMLGLKSYATNFWIWIWILSAYVQWRKSWE